MIRTYLFIAFFFTAFFFVIIGVSAQDEDGKQEKRVQPANLASFCEGATSNAEVIDCLNKDLAQAQSQLNIHFDALKNALDGESRDLLAASQGSWISYKDTQCALEIALPKNDASLTRAYELSCFVDLTKKRLKQLDQALNVLSGADKKKLTPSPFWMSQIIKSNPAIFWDFAKVVREDLNCDGLDDRMVLGVGPAEGNNKHAISLLGIVHGVSSGRQSAYVTPFDSTKGGNSFADLCVAGFTVEDSPLTPTADGQAQQCAHDLVSPAIEGKHCVFRLLWDENNATYSVLRPVTDSVMEDGVENMGHEAQKSDPENKPQKKDVPRPAAKPAQTEK